VVRLRGIEADIDENEAPVLAPAGEFAACSHTPGIWLGEVAFPHSAVLGLSASGDQKLDGLSEEFRPLVAEDFLGLGIGEDDFTRFIDHHHSTGRGLHHESELLRLQLRLDRFRPPPAPAYALHYRRDCVKEKSGPPSDSQNRIEIHGIPTSSPGSRRVAPRGIRAAVCLS
jgi:hypothetical protein